MDRSSRFDARMQPAWTRLARPRKEAGGIHPTEPRERIGRTMMVYGSDQPHKSRSARTPYGVLGRTRLWGAARFRLAARMLMKPKGQKWRAWEVFDPTNPKTMPRLPGVYVIFQGLTVVYVGSSRCVRHRMQGHRLDGNAGRSNYYSKSSEWTALSGLSGKFCVTHKFGEWLMLEARLIRRLSPSHNRQKMRAV